ncbi:ESX secretion-associated protein EspG [Nocardia sp. NPDC051570]|uniref:ESX secretion-associated protein EspG n=1 Tax=Nocardia sp. NPDC051570 TaxID=3364324 RepID=UPI0037B572D6
MTLSWEFTGLEFQVLCERFREGAMPTPLFYTLDEPMTLDESARLKQTTWLELRAKWDPLWDSMIEVMCAPDLFIRLRGWDEQDMENGSKRLYMHFARSGAQAFRFSQKPGKSFWHTDGFTVTECDPRGLAAAVVRSLPAVEAGRISSVPVVTDPQAYVGHGGGSMFRDDDDDDAPAARSSKFWQTRATLTGTVLIAQGRSKYGPRGIHETKMLWRDVVGDGRYVMAMDDAPVAMATGPTRFAERIQADINNLMQRLDTHWEAGVEGGYDDDRY